MKIDKPLINPSDQIVGSLVESFLMSIINSIADPVFVKDTNHRWVLLNKSFCEFIGHTRDELLGKSDYDFFPKEQADVFWKKDEEVLKNEKTNVNEEAFTDAFGDERIIVTKKSVYVDNLGQKYIVGIIRDVTETKKINEYNKSHTKEISKLQKEISRLKHNLEKREIK